MGSVLKIVNPSMATQLQCLFSKPFHSNKHGLSRLKAYCNIIDKYSNALSIMISIHRPKTLTNDMK